MNEPEDFGESQLRDALRAAVPPHDRKVDPVAARRAGDMRARTRTAVTTSLAFSLVILAGFGAVFFAAHRSRPATLGSDGTVEASVSPSVSASSSAAPIAVYGYLTPTTPTAGQPVTLTVNGNLVGGAQAILVSWGDGVHGGFDSLLTCASPAAAPQSVHRTFDHTYAAAGPVGVMITASTCAGPVSTSFTFTVLPAPAATVVTSIPPLKPSGKPSPSATPTPSGSPSASATPRPSGKPRPTASVGIRPASPSPASTRQASPTPRPTAKVTPTATVTPTARVTPTRTP